MFLGFTTLGVGLKTTETLLGIETFSWDIGHGFIFMSQNY